jgi:hypothetical protein
VCSTYDLFPAVHRKRESCRCSACRAINACLAAPLSVLLLSVFRQGLVPALHDALSLSPVPADVPASLMQPRL